MILLWVTQNATNAKKNNLMQNMCFNFLIVDRLCKKYIDVLVIEISFFSKQCPLKYKSGSTWWSTIAGAKVVFDLVIFLIFDSNISLDLHGSI